MKHVLHRALVGALLAAVACTAHAAKKPRGELYDTPWEDTDEEPWSEWRVVSEKPRLLQRQRVSEDESEDEKEWSDGYVSQIELKNEDNRTIKFDLDAKAAAGAQRCEKSVVMLIAIRKGAEPVRTPCEVEAGATLHMVVLSARRGEVTISNFRAFPWIDLDKMKFTEQKVLSQNPRVTLLARVSEIGHEGDSTWPAGFLAQFQVVSEAPYAMDFSAQLLTAKVGDQGGRVACDGTALTVPNGSAENPFSNEPCWVASKDTRAFSAVLAQRDGFSLIEAHNRPPQGWIGFKDPALAGVFWKGETGARQDTIIPADDPSKESVGYEVAVTFFNARTEPAIVNFVVVPNVGKPPESMPDPNRQIGGGTVTLLGGEVKKVTRASIVREWTLWVAPRKAR
ncbi:MAG: hypothetical protein ACT4PK_02185 [Gammaproteobacteria bacterium]